MSLDVSKLADLAGVMLKKRHDSRIMGRERKGVRRKMGARYVTDPDRRASLLMLTSCPQLGPPSKAACRSSSAPVVSMSP